MSNRRGNRRGNRREKRRVVQSILLCVTLRHTLRNSAVKKRSGHSDEPGNLSDRYLSPRAPAHTPALREETSYRFHEKREIKHLKLWKKHRKPEVVSFHPSGAFNIRGTRSASNMSLLRSWGAAHVAHGGQSAVPVERAAVKIVLFNRRVAQRKTAEYRTAECRTAEVTAERKTAECRTAEVTAERKPQNIEPQNVAQSMTQIRAKYPPLRNSVVSQTRKKHRKTCKTKPEDTVSFLLTVGMTRRFLFYETGLCCRQRRQHNPVFF